MKFPGQCPNQLCFTSPSPFTDTVIRKLGEETKQRLFKHKEEIPQGHQTRQRQLQWILMGEPTPCCGHPSVQLPAVQICACKEPTPPLTWVASSGVSCTQTETHLPVPSHLCCGLHWQLLPLPPLLQVQGAAEAKCQLRVQ